MTTTVINLAPSIYQIDTVRGDSLDVTFPLEGARAQGGAT